MSEINRNENPARDAARRKAKAGALRSCLSSLLCMVLCLTMFFGTSYAYFTDSVSNGGNVIQVGALQADLLLKKNGTNISLRQNPTQKVFTSEDSWGPGVLVLRTLTVKNDGDLPVAYRLFLTWNAGASDDEKADMLAVAQYFEVYVCSGERTAVTIDGITAENSGWTKIGTTMQEILGSDTPLLSNWSNENTVNALNKNESQTYTIAIYMKDTTEYESLNGETINFTVQLRADQVPASNNTTPTTAPSTGSGEGNENP